MDRTELIRQGKDLLHRNRVLLALLLLGILLLTLPANTGKTHSEPAPQAAAVRSESLEEILSRLLSQVSGAGKVQVLLTQQIGEEIHYQMDEDSRTETISGSSRQETVILTDSARNQSGLIARVDPPRYLGAVILCQGADRASVRLELTKAVSSATGLNFDRITVLKMK